MTEYYTNCLVVVAWVVLTLLMVYLTSLAHFHIKVKWIMRKHKHLSRFGAEEMYDDDIWLFLALMLEGMFIGLPSIIAIKNYLLQ